jgi:hypothetical protein
VEYIKNKVSGQGTGILVGAKVELRTLSIVFLCLPSSPQQSQKLPRYPFSATPVSPAFDILSWKSSRFDLPPPPVTAARRQAHWHSAAASYGWTLRSKAANFLGMVLFVGSLHSRWRKRSHDLHVLVSILAAGFALSLFLNARFYYGHDVGAKANSARHVTLNTEKNKLISCYRQSIGPTPVFPIQPSECFQTLPIVRWITSSLSPGTPSGEVRFSKN